MRSLENSQRPLAFTVNPGLLVFEEFLGVFSLFDVVKQTSNENCIGGEEKKL